MKMREIQIIIEKRTLNCIRFNNTLKIKSRRRFCFAIKNKITPDDKVKNFARCPDYRLLPNGENVLTFPILNLRTM